MASNGHRQDDIDLAIAYRIYPGVSKLPAAWGHDKLTLASMCLASFKEALGSLRVKIWALLDGCPPEYEQLFRRYFRDDQLIVLHLDGIGNLPTFSRQIEILAGQNVSELVYFAEDDYFYLPNALSQMVEFARANPDADFVTPYDHSGNYIPPLARERHLVRPFGKRHWRTSTATCLTFLAKRTALLKTSDLFKTYARRNEDGSIWIAITQKYGLLDMRIYGTTSILFKLWLKAWFWGYRQILFGGTLRLWGPLPSVATHLESTCLAPAIDWQAHFREAEKRMVPGAQGSPSELEANPV